jgi:hypothetical protein
MPAAAMAVRLIKLSRRLGLGVQHVDQAVPQLAPGQQLRRVRKLDSSHPKREACLDWIHLLTSCWYFVVREAFFPRKRLFFQIFCK